MAQDDPLLVDQVEQFYLDEAVASDREAPDEVSSREAAKAAVLLNQPDQPIGSTYLGLKDKMGTEEGVKQVQAEAYTQTTTGDINTLIQTAQEEVGSVPVEQTEADLQGAADLAIEMQAFKEQETGYKLSELVLPRVADVENDNFSLDDMFKDMHDQQKLDNYIAIQLADTQFNLKDILIDLAELIPPGIFPAGTAFGKLAATGEVSPQDFALMGDALNDELKWIDKQPNLELKKQAVDRIMKWGHSNGAFRSKNNILTMDALTRILETPEGLGSIERQLWNLLGIVDYIPLVGGVRKVFNIGRWKPLADSLAEVLRGSSPVKYADIAAEVAVRADGSELGKAVGLSHQAVAEEVVGIIPLSDTAVPYASGSIGRRLDKIRAQEYVTASEAPAPVPWLAPVERVETIRRLHNEAVNNPSMHLEFMKAGNVKIGKTFPSNERVAEQGTSQGITIKAFYGKGPGVPFPTRKEAIAGMESLGDLKARSRVLEDRKDRFYVQTDFEYSYNPLTDVFAKLGFEGVPIERGTGVIGSFFIDNGNRLNNTFMKALNISVDTPALVKHNYAKLLQPFVRLKPTPMKNVLRVLDEGARFVNPDKTIGKDFDLQELFAMFPNLTEREVGAYYSTRAAANVLYRDANAVYKHRLDLEHMKWVYSSDDKFSAPGTVLKKPPLGEVKEVFDPITHKFTKVNDADLAALYASGKSIVKLRSQLAFDDGFRGAKYVVADGKAIKTAELPSTILHRTGGWTPRVWAENYFVHVYKEMEINGGKVPIWNQDGTFSGAAYRKAEGAFENKRDAGRFADKLRGEYAKEIKDGRVHVEVYLDKNLARGTDAMEEHLTSSGRTIFSHRGGPLEGMSTNGLAELKDPVDAITQAFNSIANMMTKDDMLLSMEQRLKQLWGHQLADHKNVWAGLREDIATNDAIEFFNLMKVYKGVRDPHEVHFKSAMIRLADWVSAKEFPLSSKIANQLFNLSDAKPIKSVLSANFGLTIASNAIRHLYLQASQFLITGAISPTMAVRGIPTAQSLLLALAVEKHPKMMSILAKGAGMSTSDFTALFKIYKRSGLPFTLKQHQYVGQAMSRVRRNIHEGVAMKTALAVPRAVSATVKAPFKVLAHGFYGGELENLTLTFAMGHHMWKKANPKLLWKNNLDLGSEWAALARGRTFNATHIGGAKMQRGVLAPAFQFMAFQLKAWYAILNSPLFTRSQKFRMAGATALLYGFTGFGPPGKWLWEQAEKAYGETIPDVVRWVIGNGFLDWGISQGVTLAGGRDSEGRPASLAVSESMSPLGGIEMLTNNILDTDKTLIEIAGGPTFSNISKVNQAYTVWKEAWTRKDWSTAEKMIESVDAAARLIKVYDNATRMHWALQTGQAVTSSTFSPTARISAGEAVMKGIADIPSRKIEEYYRLWRDRYDIIEDVETRLAKQYARTLNKIALENPNDPTAVLEKVSAASNIFAGYDNEGIDRMRHKAAKYMKGELAKDNDTVLSVFLKDLKPLTKIKEFADLVSYIKVAYGNLLTPENKAQLDRFVEKEMAFRSYLSGEDEE